MRTDATAHDRLEVIPIIYNFVAAVPTFLDVVKDGLARMEPACCTIVLTLVVHLAATWPSAFLLLFGFHWNVLEKTVVLFKFKILFELLLFQ